MCQGGLKLGQIQGQQQVGGAVGVFGLGRQIAVLLLKQYPVEESSRCLPSGDD